jgi:hypothetical protein
VARVDSDPQRRRPAAPSRPSSWWPARPPRRTQQRLEPSVNGLCPWQFACAYCAVQVDAGLWAQTRPCRAPTGGPCLQCVQQQRINAVVERRPAAARSIRERSPVDPLTIVRLSMVSNIRTQFRAHIDPVCGRVVKYHDQNPDRIANAEKMLKIPRPKASRCDAGKIITASAPACCGAVRTRSFLRS